ncbi:MAG TPA: hypothetical protein PKZ43_00275 [Bacteroidales bacterium]|mgnify:FL=1|nr:hypothetical protein [Bacteroidales bacterium]
MKKIILLFCIYCFCSNLFGQEVLVFKKKKNLEEKILDQNEKIKIKTSSGNVYKGYFTIKRDTLTLLGEGKISIHNVKMIAICQTEKESLIGSFAVTTGAYTLLLSSMGMQLIVESIKMNFFSILTHPIIILPIFITTAGIIILSKGKNYKNSEWDYVVRNME